MIELVGIVLSLLTFFIFSIFPLTVNFSDQYLLKYKFYKYDFLLINLLINFVLLLLLSFTKINLSYYFIFLVFLSLSFNLVLFFKDKTYFLKFKEINFLYFILLNLIIFVFIAKDPTLSWDGQKNWFYKSQSFFYNYNFFDLNKILGVDYYPHLGPYLWGFFWKNSLLNYEYSGRFIYVFIFLLSIFSICDLLNVKKNIKALIITIVLLVSFDNFLFKGYQEVLVFSLLIFASKNIYNYILYQKKINLIFCFVCLNLLPWIKNEGYLFLIIFIISQFLIIKKFPKKIEIISLIFLSILLLLFKKFLFLYYLDINLTHGGNINLTITINDFINYIKSIVTGFIIAVFKYKIWIFIFFSMFYFSMNKKINKKDDQFLNFLKINMLLYLFLILGIYFSVTDHIYGIQWWVDNSLDRILFQVSGIFLIYVVLAVNYLKIKF